MDKKLLTVFNRCYTRIKFLASYLKREFSFFWVRLCQGTTTFPAWEEIMSLTLMSLFSSSLIKQKTQCENKNERARMREKGIKKKQTGKAKQFKSFNLAFKRFSLSLFLRDTTVKENGFSYFQSTTIYIYIYLYTPTSTHTNVQRGGSEEITMKKMLKLYIKGMRGRESLF